MTIQSTFSKIAENPTFVAFWAHAGFAFMAATVALHYYVPMGWVAALSVMLAAVKEYYVDIHFETTPPQTYADSTLDFVGYMTGLVAAGWLATH